MAFKVSQKTWLQVEGDRVERFLTMPKYWGFTWDHDRLQAALARIGLKYTMDEIKLLNDEMHKRGIVDDVGE